jgi:ligand-binding sensor domain-containing protein
LDHFTGNVHNFSESDGLPRSQSATISYISEDHAGQVWIGIYRSGVARFRNGHFDLFGPAEGIPAGGIRYIYTDSRNRVWLASGRGGLGRIDDPQGSKPRVQRYTTADGLSSDEIQCITEDRFGRIYAGTGLGVDRLNPATGEVLHYTTADGVAQRCHRRRYPRNS